MYCGVRDDLDCVAITFGMTIVKDVVAGPDFVAVAPEPAGARGVVLFEPPEHPTIDRLTNAARITRYRLVIASLFVVSRARQLTGTLVTVTTTGILVLRPVESLTTRAVNPAPIAVTVKVRAAEVETVATDGLVDTAVNCPE